MRISRMPPALGYSSGKVKEQGIETFSGSRMQDLQFIAEFLPLREYLEPRHDGSHKGTSKEKELLRAKIG